MLHVLDPHLTRAMSPHPANDRHAHHRHDLTTALRAEARARRARFWQRLRAILTGRSSRPRGLSSRRTEAPREESLQA